MQTRDTKPDQPPCLDAMLAKNQGKKTFAGFERRKGPMKKIFDSFSFIGRFVVPFSENDCIIISFWVDKYAFFLYNTSYMKNKYDHIMRNMW